MKKLSYLVFLLFTFCSSQENKINGISFVASNTLTSQKEVNPVKEINANWVTLMPFAFMKTLNDTTIFYNSKRQWIGEREEGIVNASTIFHSNQMKIMLKPQIWIPRGFTGHIEMKTEEEWMKFENNYAKFILFYAELAQKQSIELLCIGTELNYFVKNRPQFWHTLIQKIKKTYKGQLTYAENWDTYQNVPFFKELDYIGIDAYFPLANEQTPTISQLEEKWSTHKNSIANFSKNIKKKVLFTEYGYQSMDYTTHEPWNFSKEKKVNLLAQKNALQALYNEFWHEDWFAGGFLWKWFENHSQVGGLNDTDYTVQNKPSFEIVKQVYEKMK
ncbi:glycoside hydrolase [Flavobacterium jejuense]|uniref:Glycoside hydrolase n=1 Tax=Flavobacterium jejuense TaxID=1544455 RepID=A0ABX0IVL8_9FLAO|nr:glycoside hydrolase [Flavobacterium jejuense]NHN27226.1 glycoside hydrolase [Flavobacterium jejuense]